MDMNAVFRAAEIIIYAAQAWTALYGVFCVVLLARRIRQQQFATAARADEFLGRSASHWLKNDLMKSRPCVIRRRTGRRSSRS